jgi:Ni,Fe-hydrogenase I cytochrome b subunit
MPNAAEELGYPTWLNAFAVLIFWVIGLIIGYGLIAFIAWDPDPYKWGTFVRLIAVVTGLIWTGLVIDATGDEE